MSKGREVRVFEYVNQPFERVRAALLANAPALFSRATSAASERTRHLVAALRVSVAGIAIGKEVHIEVRGSSDSDHSASGAARETRIELRWSAVGDATLFPTMTAELALYPLSSTETQLDLRGTYEAPFGALGAAFDALIGHRIAEASVHRFIVDVAEQLRRELDSSAAAR